MKSVSFRGKEIKYNSGDDFWNGLYGWEEKTFDILDKYIGKDSVFFDIGAYNGVLSIYASMLGAKCVCFEPDKTAFDQLTENLELNNTNAICYNVAVSDTDGVENLSNQSDKYGDSMSSLIQRNGFPEGYSVDTTKLESFMQYCNTKPTFIKIDTEGAEIKIIPSSVYILRELDCPLYLSLHPFWFPDREENLSEIYEALIQVYKLDYIKSDFLKLTSSCELLLLPK